MPHAQPSPSQVHHLRSSLVRHARIHLPPEQAEDAAQETLARTFSALRRGTCQPEGVGGFAHGTLRRVLLEEYRRASRWQPLSEEACVSSKPSPLDALLAAEVRALSEAAIRRTPAGQHTALRACLFEGFDCAEVARQTGVPPARVRKWKSRLLIGLRATLGVRAAHREPAGPDGLGS